MSWSRVFHLLAGLVLLPAWLGVPAPLQGQDVPGRQARLDAAQLETLRTEVREAGGRVIVGFKPASAPQGLGPDASPLLSGAEVRSIVGEHEGTAVLEVKRQYSLIPAVVAVVDPARLEELLADPRVDYVEPDRRVGPHGGELEPDASAGPSAAAAAAAQTLPWGVDRIGAPLAWANTRGAGVSVGIIASGIDADHPDLSPVGGINLITGGTTAADWDDASPDCFSTGTRAAGTVAALDNAEGVVGVAPEADLYALRVFDPESEGVTGCTTFTSSLLDAIEWATTNGLDVVDVGFSLFGPTLSVADAAAAGAASGLVLVAPAVNWRGYGVDFPAAYPSVVAVAASDESDEPAFFSGQGPEVEVTAPGTNILSTTNDGATGTSSSVFWASPHVAGVAALLRAAQPGLAPTEIRSLLQGTAVDISAVGVDRWSGHGLVNAAVAVSAAAGNEGALAVVPVAVLLTAPTGSTQLVSAAVEIRSVGATGTVGWTASTDASWLGVSATSGSSSDANPASLTITADPAGVSGSTLHHGNVTIDGTFAGAPLTVPVILSVEERVAVDAATAVRRSIAVGQRHRLVFSGTAGQRVDIALLSDEASSNPLVDPIVRLYMPDGATQLAVNDDAWIELLERQSLIRNVGLPVDGDYVIEIGSWRDAFSGDVIVKVRPAGPILGMRALVDGTHQYFGSFANRLRAAEGGAATTADVEIVNLNGVGTLDWSASMSSAWMSLSPSSGAATSAGFVALAGADEESFRSPEPGSGLEMDGSLAEIETWERELMELRSSPTVTATSGPARAAPTAATLSVDPAGLALGQHVDTIVFQTDGWVTPRAPVEFRVHSADVSFMSPGHPFSGVATDGLDQAVGLAFLSEEILPIGVDGTVGAALASGVGFVTQGFTRGLDGSWYIPSRTEGAIYQVTRDGAISLFASGFENLNDVIAGPEGEFYVPARFDNQVYRLSADGATVDPVGDPLTAPTQIAYSPVDNALYVRAWTGSGWGVFRIDLETGATENVFDSESFQVFDLTAGSSGTVYLSDWSTATDGGRLWSYDPATGTAEQLSVLPDRITTGRLAVIEGSVVVGSASAGCCFINEPYGTREGYLVPVSDGAPPQTPIRARVTAELAAGTLGPQALLGESFTVPVELDLAFTPSPVAGYDAELTWTPEELTFEDVSAGDFGGSFSAATGQTGSGVLGASSTRTDGLSTGAPSLFEVQFVVDPASVTAGQRLALGLGFAGLSDDAGGDLLDQLVVRESDLCVAAHAHGDVTTDGAVGSADAVQILRGIVGLPLAVGVDETLADVNRDGSAGTGDVVEILRYLVELSIPAESAVDRLGIGGCP